MNNKLQKLPPPWHQEAKQLLSDNFAKIHAQFLDSTKRAVWLGIFLNDIKRRGKEDGSIPHGEFLPWLKNNLPDISDRLAQTYMALASNVLEKGKFQIRDFSVFAHNGKLPPEVEKMIEGKTQQQLFLSFKNVDADGNPLKAGCKPGKRGPAKDKSIEDDELDFIDGVRADIAGLCDEDDDALAKYPADRRERLEIACRALLQRILEIKRTVAGVAIRK